MELVTDELTLHYEDDGDDAKPPILFLHGITQSVETWSWIVPSLVDDYRVVRLDFRGHGRSGRAAGTYDFPHYVADATTICERVLERPAVVVGHSLGGGTAAGLAQTRPELVRGVVLEDPAIIAAPSHEVDVEAAAAENPVFQGFRLMRDSIPRLQGSGMTADVLAGILRNAPSMSGGTFGDSACDDALDAMAAGMLSLDVSVLDAVFDGSHKPVFDPQRELPVPGILVAGDQSLPDTVLRAPVTGWLAEHSPKLEQRFASGVGHMIHDSKAQRSLVLEAVRDLVSRV